MAKAKTQNEQPFKIMGFENNYDFYPDGRCTNKTGRELKPDRGAYKLINDSGTQVRLTVEQIIEAGKPDELFNVEEDGGIINEKPSSNKKKKKDTTLVAPKKDKKKKEEKKITPAVNTDGKKSHAPNLTYEKAQDIRKMKSEGAKIKDITAIYGNSSSSVYFICTNEAHPWKEGTPQYLPLPAKFKK